jgi:trk system potassium uptake protein TrkA
MHIVVVGAGQVGSYLAERLSLEGQDVVVIESDADRASEMQASLDCLVVHGNGSSPAVLEEAGVASAGMLIAVTSSDAVNVLACQAGTGLGVPLKIARVTDPSLRPGLEKLGVDVIIDPVETLAHELVRLVRRGGVSEITDFADGGLVLLGGYVAPSAPAAGVTLAELRRRVTGWDWIVAALVRDGQTFVARGDTMIHEGDHVLIMARADRTTEATKLLGLQEHPARKVIIFGTTRLAEITADLLTRRGIQTIVIDQDHDRARSFAKANSRVIVVEGDPTDPRVMASEGIDNVDAVLALTGMDELNITAGLVARALGVDMAVVRLKRVELIKLLAGVGLETGVSTRLSAANAILRFVRRGHIRSVVTFQDTDAEAIELQVGAGGKVLGRSLAELGLPRSVIIGGVLRKGEPFVPTGATVIEEDDRLIVFALPEGISTIEELFG